MYDGDNDMVHGQNEPLIKIFPIYHTCIVAGNNELFIRKKYFPLYFIMKVEKERWKTM